MFCLLGRELDLILQPRMVLLFGLGRVRCVERVENVSTVVVAVETKFEHGALLFSLGRQHRVSFPRGKRLLELIYVSLLQNARKGYFFETKIKLLMYLKVVLLQKRREVKIVCDFVFPNFRKMVGNPDHTKPKFANINISLR